MNISYLIWSCATYILVFAFNCFIKFIGLSQDNCRFNMMASLTPCIVNVYLLQKKLYCIFSRKFMNKYVLKLLYFFIVACYLLPIYVTPYNFLLLLLSTMSFYLELKIRIFDRNLVGRKSEFVCHVLRHINLHFMKSFSLNWCSLVV